MAGKLSVPVKKKKKLTTLQKAALVAALPVLPLALPIIESMYNPIKSAKIAAQVITEPYNPNAWENLAKYKADAIQTDFRLGKRLIGEF